MASNLFVRWNTHKGPSREEAEKVIQDFFSEVANEVEWREDRFFVTLVGKWSHPLARVANAPFLKRMYADDQPGGRYMEVQLGKDGLHVLTERQDEFTHACQDGLAAVFARYWEGTVEG